MEQDDLTTKQLDEAGRSKYAVFLPALSSFYGSWVGRQRSDPSAVPPTRIPAGMENGIEGLNWLNSQKGNFTYKWILYSAGHADLDMSKAVPKEDMVRNRDKNTILLGDSGGFQIGKGVWKGDWRDPFGASVKASLDDCVARKTESRTVTVGKNTQKVITVDLVAEHNARLAAAEKKRSIVLTWLDQIADYSMILDIPAWAIHDPAAVTATCIATFDDAVSATKYNNEYFMAKRKGINNGGTKFLNVLQGSTHGEADRWYEIMKEYCDPTKYPDTHFNGWSMGGQHTADVHLVLKRLVALRYDNLLQEGVHDWMHFLGVGRLPWAILLTDIQRAVRANINPNFTISFDAASAFVSTANAQLYTGFELPHQKKWRYIVRSAIDDKKYATDTRMFRDAIKADNLYNEFLDSPVTARLQMKDVCHYAPGDLNKVGKEGKTSWDSFSYCLQMGHNVWMQLHAVQEANRQYDAGNYPAMMRNNNGDHALFRDIVNSIFAAATREESESIIEHYSRYWMDIPGSKATSGKKAVNANTMFDVLFSRT